MIKNIKELKFQDDILPDKPSELIYLALEDVETFELDSEYSVDMEVWHSITEESEDEFVCQVCFAGAVITKSYEPSLLLNISEEDFKGSIRKKMLALDCFRQGETAYGLEHLGLKIPKELNKLEGEYIISNEGEDEDIDNRVYNFEDMIQKDFTHHKQNPERFKEDMLAMADLFDSMGM